MSILCTNGSLRCDLGSAITSGDITIACFVGWDEHQNDGSADYMAVFGEFNNSLNSALAIRSEVTDGTFAIYPFDSGGASSSATRATSSTFGDSYAWFGVGGRYDWTDATTMSYQMRVNTYGNGSSITTARNVYSGSGLQYVTIGATPTDTAVFKKKIAEVAIWKRALTDEELDLFFSGTSANQIQSGDLIFYNPFRQSDWNADSVKVHTNNLTTSGSTPPAYDSSHPTIDYATAVEYLRLQTHPSAVQAEIDAKIYMTWET